MCNKLHYVLDGNGDKTVVMLHGWGLNGKAFDMLHRAIETKAKCLIVDFYGFGESGEPETYYDTYEYAYQIFLLLNKLDIKKIVLVGHSFGGRVAIILSSIFDIDICGMVLTSSAGLNRFSLKKSIRILRYKLCKYLAKMRLIRKDRLSKFGSSDYKKLSSNLKANFVKIVRQDLGCLLNKIHTPSSLFWAKDDRETPMWICRKLHRKIKNSKLVLSNDGGHFVYLKRPHKFQEVVERYI